MDVLERVTHFALLESFVVHLRNLLQFIYPRDPQSGEVILNDFFDDDLQWKRERVKETETLRSARTRAHKEVSHLTIYRLNDDDPAKPWEFLKLARLLKAVFRTFVDNASPAKLDPKIELRIRRIAI